MSGCGAEMDKRELSWLCGACKPPAGSPEEAAPGTVTNPVRQLGATLVWRVVCNVLLLPGGSVASPDLLDRWRFLPFQLCTNLSSVNINPRPGMLASRDKAHEPHCLRLALGTFHGKKLPCLHTLTPRVCTLQKTSHSSDPASCLSAHLPGTSLSASRRWWSASRCGRWTCCLWLGAGAGSTRQRWELAAPVWWFDGIATTCNCGSTNTFD